MQVFQLLPRFSREVFSRFQEDHCLQLASSLTFTTLLSLVPLVTVTLVLVSVFPMFGGITGHIDDFLAAHVLPEQIGRTIKIYFDQIQLRSGRLTAIGTLFLVLAGIINMMTIERAFNAIWRVPHPRPTAQRIMVYWAVLTLGPFLIGASVTMTSYLVSASLGFVKDAPLLGEFNLRLLPVLLAVAAFTLLYVLVPARAVKRQHALIGGIVAGLLFELAKRGFALYVARSPGYTMVYGAFATIPVFLMWIYLSWVVAALGAVVVATLPDFWLLRAERVRPQGADYRDVLDILLTLVASRRSGKVPDAYWIAKQVKLPLARCENLLEAMEGEGWVGQLQQDQWVLVRDSEAIKLHEVCKKFSLAPEQLASGLPRGVLAGHLETLAREVDSILALSLSDLAKGQEGDRG
jgi:membrane protein